jgi:hypothetical protein
MKTLKAAILILTLSTIFTDDDTGLVSLEQSYLQETFLEPSYRIHVEVEKCETVANSSFETIQIKLDPPEIIRYNSYKCIVNGMMLREETVKNLEIKTFLDGNIIIEDTVNKGSVKIKEGPYSFIYEAAVPWYTPAGNWDIFVYLVNSKDENIACIKMSFST